MKKYLFVLVILFSLVACQKSEVTEMKAAFSMSDKMLERCQFAEVKVEPVRSELKLFGKVAADNNRMAHVYPVVGGSVLKINVELGDYVEQGQVLAVVRSSEVADLQKQRLEAQLNIALAEKNLQVIKDLYEGKLASDKDLISAQKELEKSRAEYNRINEVYSIYGLKAGSIYNITAPMSGFIVQKDINQNELLRSDKSDVLFTIAQIDEIWVLGNVNESNIARVKVGTKALVSTISYPDKVFEGKIDKIFNAIDPETKAMKVLVKIKNTDLLLKPEMSATITLLIDEKTEMTAIPASAVIFDKNKTWVMVFKDRNNIETRQVEVYRQTGQVAYIAKGLQVGEKVISKEALFIYDALND
ncbi:MAG: efflux RND transporter periplasmic adaptor subunit [Raineya sp.]|nr:efflux RND transporter periplasmic adaptor subunit [Raineya sp.]